jgi:hypothetical protein
MSHPQPKRPSAADLIEKHSKARVRAATPVSPMLAKLTKQRQLDDSDARAQVASLR